MPEGAAQMQISAQILWRIYNPYHFLNTKGMKSVEETIVGITTSLIRNVASRTQVNALMAKKIDAQQMIRDGINSKKGPRRPFKPAITEGDTFLFGVIVALLIYLPSFFTETRLEAVAFRLLSIAVFFSGIRRVPIGYGAAVTRLGRRMQGSGDGVNIKEGWYWLPWPLFGIERVDMRLQKTTIDGDKMIDVIAGNAEGADSDIPNIGDEVDRNFSAMSGADVERVDLPKIMPDQKVLDALEKKRIAQAEMEAAAEKSRRLQETMSEFKKTNETASPELAANFAFGAAGLPLPVPGYSYDYDHDVIQVSGATDADKALGSGIALMREMRGMAQSFGGGGGGGGKRNKQRRGPGGNPGNQGGQGNQGNQPGGKK